MVSPRDRPHLARRSVHAFQICQSHMGHVFVAMQEQFITAFYIYIPDILSIWNIFDDGTFR